MWKPRTMSLAFWGLIGATCLSSSAQQLRPSIGGGLPIGGGSPTAVSGAAAADSSSTAGINPVAGNVLFNSGNSTLGGATDLLFDTQSNAAAPKVPLSTIAPAQLAISIEPAEVALNDLRGIQIIVANHTDRPIVVDGNLATVVLCGQKMQACSLQQITTSTCPEVTRKQRAKRIIEAAATVGTIPTIEDQKLNKGPILARYGCDESRRINEISHFGKRVLWPGDSTGGVLYFKTDASLKGLTIQLPVNTLFVNTDGALLTILP